MKMNNFENISMAASVSDDVLPSEKIVSVDIDRLSQPLMSSVPLVSAYNDIISPIVDAVRMLRCMGVIKEGITLPKIVVIGDQSSGKSSVIESLTGISLEGICTRVPLIIRLQYHPDPVSVLYLDYDGNYIPVYVTQISEVVNLFTKQIAGNDKKISNVPLTLVLKKNSVPDLIIVDLPGTQISDITVEYIKPKENLILNVMSATADFLTCESITMSHKFDTHGERTVNVFAKADEASEDLMTIVTTNIGSDYVCVRNRLSGETYETSRTKESNLFKTHHLLSKIDKSMVGTNSLAQKLVRNQLAISNCLYGIVIKINEELNLCVLKQNKLQQHFTTISEAMPIFVQVMKISMKSFSKLAISFEFDDFPNETQTHFSTRLSEMLKEFHRHLKKNEVNGSETFLIDEILQFQDSKGFGSSSTLPPEHVFDVLGSRRMMLTPLDEHAFNSLLRRKIANISGTIRSFISRVWDYIEMVIIRVLSLHAQDYPQLYLSVETATKNVITKLKERFHDKILEFFEMKNMEDYKRHPEVIISSWKKMTETRGTLNNKDQYIRELGKFNDAPKYLEHLLCYPDTISIQVLDIKTRMVAFWDMVAKLFTDSVKSHLPSKVWGMVEKEMEEELVNELKIDGGNRYKSLLEESPLMDTRRWKLKNRIELLEKLKKVTEKAMNDSFHR